MVMLQRAQLKSILGARDVSSHNETAAAMQIIDGVGKKSQTKRFSI